MMTVSEFMIEQKTNLFIENYGLLLKKISFFLARKTQFTIEIENENDLKMVINTIVKQNSNINFVTLDLAGLIDEDCIIPEIIYQLSQTIDKEKKIDVFILKGLDNCKELLKILYEFNNVLDYPYPIIFCLSSFSIDRVIKELNHNFQSNYSYNDYFPNLISFK